MLGTGWTVADFAVVAGMMDAPASVAGRDVLARRPSRHGPWMSPSAAAQQARARPVFPDA